MNYFKDKILPILIGAIISAIGAIILSISSDLFPSIMPVFETLTVQLYLKLILLLLLLLIIISFLSIVLFLKSKNYKPLTMKGSYSGFKWVAEIKYDDKKNGVSIEIHWICPKHGIFLGWKDAEVPECNYYNLFCRKCNQIYKLKSNGDVVYVHEVERTIHQDILSKLKIENI